MGQSKNKGTIIVVDDTPTNLTIINHLLTDSGYLIRAFGLGKPAIQAAEEDPPDLFILDITMPELNGFEVCKYLKESEKLKEIPVLFLSASGDTEDKVEAFKIGGQDYITKPFQFEEIIARVDTHIKLKNYHQELKKAYEDLKATQVQLIQSEKMASLGVLTAGIAHEINNPINFITSNIASLAKLIKELKKIYSLFDQLTPENFTEKMNYIRQLKDNLVYEESLKDLEEMVDNIETGARRTADIVKGLRTFSRLDEADKKLANINENIDSALMILDHKINQSNIIIEKDYQARPILLCYPGKLNQVLLNLLSNAIDAVNVKIKADPAFRGKISVCSLVVETKPGKSIEIQVRDNGQGIAAKDLPHIFEPFYTTKEVGQGMGLGLSISYTIIQEHKGEFKVKSTYQEGTSIKIVLPLQE